MHIGSSYLKLALDIPNGSVKPIPAQSPFCRVSFFATSRTRQTPTYLPIQNWPQFPPKSLYHGSQSFLVVVVGVAGTWVVAFVGISVVKVDGACVGEVVVGLELGSCVRQSCFVKLQLFVGSEPTCESKVHHSLQKDN